MSERDKYEEFVSYGINNKISVKECIKNESIIILFSLPLIIMGVTYNICGVLGIIPIVLYPIFVSKLKKGQTIEGIFCILHSGVFLGCISFLFALAGIGLALKIFQGQLRIIVICIVGAGYVLAGLLYKFMFIKMVEGKKYTNGKKAKVEISASLGAILGYYGARTFLKDIGPVKALEIVCVLCFLLSYLTLIGIINIFKFQYLKKQNKKDKDK